MQATETRTIHAILALRKIADHSVYSNETTSRIRTPAPRRIDDPGKQAETWARRAAQANGFGGM